jgi:hypothetical protein
MKTVLTMIFNCFAKREITRETVRASIKADAEREIMLNWFYQAN